MEKEIVLSAIGYFVKIRDKTVYFRESRPIYGIKYFSLSRHPISSDGNLTPGTWYLNTEGDQQIPSSHILAAIQYCETNYGRSFEPYPEGF